MNRHIHIPAMLLSLLILIGTAQSRVPSVRVSQAAEVRQTIGLADVSVRFHRPGVKGREIWGGLLPYGEVWRAGANEPTLVTFSENVTIAGTSLKAGTYRIVVVPMKDAPWNVIFNSEVKNWGSIYDKQYDVATVPVQPAEVQHTEWMSFSFDALTGTSADLMLCWEKIGLRIPLSFDTEGIFASKAAALTSDVWRAKNSYARYLLEFGDDPQKALSIAEEAVAMDKNIGTLRTKAEILAKLRRYADAVTVMQEAVEAGKAQNPNMNTGFYEGFITRWKEMK